MNAEIEKLLGDSAKGLLDHKCKTIPKDRLHLPGPDFVDRIVALSDRNPQVMRSLQAMFNRGRLAGTGYMSILPVDQGIEHSGGASFAKNPDCFDPENIVKLAMEGGCNAVASTLGVLGAVSPRDSVAPAAATAVPALIASIPGIPSGTGGSSNFH